MVASFRRGTEADARAAADLWLRARRAAVEAIPPPVHDDDDVRAYFSSHVVRNTELWVAEDPAGALVGLLVLDGQWVEQLYVAPTMTGRGIGSSLVTIAKRERPRGLRLWTFASNTGAQRFYERHGFVATRRTEGDNEEGAPDILYVWSGVGRFTIVAAIFDSIFVPEAVQETVSDRAWLQAMLDAEAALAAAQAAEGVISADAAAAVARACEGEFDLSGAREAANPVVPLARALRERAPDAHLGATSQDILDTAAMLVARRARVLILAELDAVAGACARLADEHRGTPMAARTLMQQALPTTFGLKAAGWLAAVATARDGLAAVPLAAQLGGAAGTLAGLGPAVPARFAAELGLDEPPLPWHGDRTRVAALGAALAIAAGACEKVALDIVLLAQNEVGEVAESSEGGRGGSSAMAHKRNQVGAVRARAAARSARGAAGVLLEAMAGEHERAAGAWQSEWGALSAALAGAGGAAWSLREALDGLTVDPQRMAANLEGLPGDFDQATVDLLIDRALERT